MLDKSGSCAIICMFIDDHIYISNVGDSRAIMSMDGGRYIASLSIDHKPDEKTEEARITENGGKIY